MAKYKGQFSDFLKMEVNRLKNSEVEDSRRKGEIKRLQDRIKQRKVGNNGK